MMLKEAPRAIGQGGTSISQAAAYHSSKDAVRNRWNHLIRNDEEERK